MNNNPGRRVLCLRYRDDFIKILGIDIYRNLTECIGFQVVSSYLGLKLFNETLTIYEYLDTEKYRKLYTMCVKAFLKSLNIKLTPMQLRDYDYLIRGYVIELVQHGYKYNACLVLEDE